MTNWWVINKENDLKKLKKDTVQFLSNLEKTLENFDQTGDPSKLKDNLKKTINEFKDNLD